MSERDLFDAIPIDEDGECDPDGEPFVAGVDCCEHGVGFDETCDRCDEHEAQHDRVFEGEQ